MAKSPDNVQLWNIERAKIEHEDKWIQQRVSWNLAATAFLLAAYSALIGAGAPPPHLAQVRWLLLGGIPLLGLSFTIFVLMGLTAAWVAQARAMKDWEDRVADEATRGRFPELHSKGTALVLGKVAAWGITIASACAWLALIEAKAIAWYGCGPIVCR